METVWITGASSGIGEACAYRWAEGGARLVITAPTAEELEPVAAKCWEKGAPDVAVLPYDLSKPEGIPALVQAAWEAFGGLTTVYLNAGISQRTSVEDTSMDMLRLLMEIDYFAPAGIAKELLPRMVAQGGGITVEKASQKIVKAIRQGRREVLVGSKELLMVYVKRFFPGLCAKLARKLKPV